MAEADERTSLLTRRVSVIPPEEPRWIKCRYVFCVMSFLGFVNVYAMRVNLSVAIVAMVNNTAISPNSTYNNDTCPNLEPVPSNSTHNNGDGPFNWDPEEQGLILGAFFYGYVLTQIPGGRLAELWGGKWLYGTGVLITSILTLLTPAAANTGVGMFTAVRIMEGLGEGVTFPAMHAMLSKWAPPNERSRLSGWVYCGASLGTVLSMPASGYMCDTYGWESVFYLFGLLGIVWFLFWAWIVADSPNSHPTISRGEKEYIAKCIGPAHSDKSPPVPWRHILTSVPNWGFYTLLTELPTYMKNILHFNIKDNSAVSALPYFLALLVSILFSPLADFIIVLFALRGRRSMLTKLAWGHYTLLTELPTFMKNILHFNIMDDAFVSAVPYLLYFIVSILFSPVADIIIDHRIMARSATRKLFNSLGFCLPAIFLVLAGYSGCDVDSTIAFLALAGGLNAFQYGGFMSTHLDMSPNFAGTLLGITNAFANLTGFLAPAFTGYIINQEQDLGHWRFVFFVASIVYFSGNMIYIGFGSIKEQPWNNIHNRTNSQEPASAQQEEGWRGGENGEVQPPTLTYIQIQTSYTRSYDPLSGASELDID